MIDLTGRPIAITGAGSGIGRATAIACARAGMPVALGGRRIEKLESAVAEIKALGGRAIAVQMDVDRPEDCSRLVRSTIDAFGSIYAVFANAGYGLERMIHLTTDAELRAIFETNFFGTMNTIRPALEVMLPASVGHVLICSSCLAKTGTPMSSAYSATKAAQDHIARAMRAELRESGVAVSSVHPIGTATEFFDRKAEEKGREVLSSPPSFLMQKPDRVARAIVKRLRKGRGAEVWTSLSIRLLFALLTAWPGIADFGFARFMRRQHRQS